MKKWVKIKDNWSLRLTIEGLEFVSYDHNISVDLSGKLPKFRDDLFEILRGIRKVNLTKKNDLTNLINNFKEKDLIFLVNNSQRVNYGNKEKLLQKLRKEVVGEKGIIKRVYLLDPDRSKYDVGKNTLFSTKYISKTGYRSKKMIEWTSGISPDPIVSEIKALMEGVERFYSGEIDKSHLVKSRGKNLCNIVNPSEIISYLDKQYRQDLSLEPYSANKKYLWLKGKSIRNNQQVFVPIDLIYYPIDKGLASHLLTFGNSNGIAAGFSYKDTLSRSLYEVIERDAFMIVWLNRLSLNQFEKHTLTSSIQDRIGKIEKVGLEVHVVNMTMDTAPAILVLAINSGKKPVILLGASAGPDIGDCISKALFEVEQGVYWEYRDDSKVIKITNPKKVLKVKEHVSLYRNVKFFKEAEFLWKGKYINFDQNKYKKISKNIDNFLIKKGMDIVVMDISPYNLKKLGVVVLRSYVLGFIPLSFGYGLEPLGMPRVREMPKILGIEANPWKGLPLPHPFP